MSWKPFMWLFVIITLIGSAYYFTDGFNITGIPDCEFTLENNYTCDLPYNLEVQREASLWQYHFQYDKVPAGEFTGRTLVTSFAAGGPYTEEDDEQYDDSCKEDREYTYIALYRIPADFPEVYDLYFEAYTDATGQIDKKGSSADMDIYVEYISIPYPYSGIEICSKDDLDDCNNGDYALVHTYTDERTSSTYGDYKEDQVNIKHEVNLDGMTREDLYVDDDYQFNVPVTQQIWAKGTVPHDALMIEGVTQSNLALMVEINSDVENRCGVDISKATNPPTSAYLSYKAAQWPTDVEYIIVGYDGTEYPIETLTGVQKDDVDTLDVGNIINKACGRDTSSFGCDFHLRVKSATPGVISVTEDHTLRISDKPIEQPEPEPEPVKDAWYKRVWAWILDIPNMITRLFY